MCYYFISPYVTYKITLDRVSYFTFPQYTCRVHLLHSYWCLCYLSAVNVTYSDWWLAGEADVVRCFQGWRRTGSTESAGTWPPSRNSASSSIRVGPAETLPSMLADGAHRHGCHESFPKGKPKHVVAPRWLAAVQHIPVE